MSQRPAHAKHTAPPARKSRPAPAPKAPKAAAKGSSKTPAVPDTTILIVRLALATVLFVVSMIVKMPVAVKMIILVLAAAAAGYDLVLEAVNDITGGSYFATPIIISFVALVSFIIGFAVEGVALVILYQIGGLLMKYVGERTKKTAEELLKRRNEDATDAVRIQIAQGDTAPKSIEKLMLDSSSLVLKGAMVFALIYAIVLPLTTSYSFIVSIHRAITILLISTPVSVVAAMPFTGMIGLAYSAQQGVMFNSVDIMETAESLNMAVFDKAGIFTDGSPRVLAIESDVLDNHNLINFASHAAYYSEQPAARAIAALNDQEFRTDIISDFEEIPGSGIDVNIGGAHVSLGTAEFLASRGVYVPQSEGDAGKPYYMSIADRYVGRFIVSDNINEDAADLASEMKAVGMRRCILLTEDSEKVGQSFAEELDFDEAFCQCSPERKLKYIDDLSQAGKNKLAFIYANGIEGHSAAELDMRVAKKAKYADAVVLPECVENIPFSFQVAKRMKEVAIENAVFAFVIKAVLIFLSIIGYCNVWFAIFIDIVAILATMLNAVRVTNESLISTYRAKAGK